METQTVVGLRYEQTKVEADAQQNVVDHSSGSPTTTSARSSAQIWRLQ